ncbi:MFS transporter, partial [bacterium]|nr:MFS transporter [bacterium]
MIGFRNLPRNARTCIVVEPLWAFFGPMVTYYMPLYQRQLGLSEVQMGLVNSVNIAAGLLFYALAAPITDRVGRRRTSLLFDFVAWSLTMALWALSRSYAWFLVAAVTNAVVRIVYVSWNLLISEDASDEQRSTIFGYINIIGTFGGITTLLSGTIIARFGVEPAMRAVFWVGAATMTLMFVL